MTDDQIQTLHGLIAHLDQADGRIHVMRDEIDALRAALALTDRRCGNCGHWQQTVSSELFGFCRLFGQGRIAVRQVADGCILGWVAKP